MKFLEYTPLSGINSFLEKVHISDYVIQGDLEAYSCKLAGTDKKLSRSLEQDVLNDLAHSPPGCEPLSASPVGPLSESASRRTLIYLILTLNHMYPDYDFSDLRAHHFTKEPGMSSVKNNIDNLLMQCSKLWQPQNHSDSNKSFLEAMWAAINEVIELEESDVYSYNSELEGDPFGEQGSVWSFNYFFYNKKLKRVLYFSCRCFNAHAVQAAAASGEDEEECYWDEEDPAHDMDL
mmetsp:Transcript_10693/g.39256  ORF Transcript_10693/g.39256 Transcript_10693/m.39256 type:complete len:235 (-) Transcript_10693:213-917(-)